MDKKLNSGELNPEMDVFNVDHSDEKMLAALEKARLTMGYFQSSLRNPLPYQSMFALKARIRDYSATEHIWLSEVSWDKDGLYYGVVSNAPIHVTNVKVGGRIGIAAADVSDWLVVENGRLIGGYTIRVYRNGLSPAAQLRFDGEMGLIIDDGVDHFVHDMSSPEGAILCLEDAYTAGNIDAAMACKDFEREVGLMLEDQADLAKAEKMILEMAEILELSFRNYMQEHGMPSFAGAERAFPARQDLDSETVLVTEVCTFKDGRRTQDQLVLMRVGDEWRVGPPANDMDFENDDS